MIKVIKIGQEGSKIIYSFETSLIKDKGKISLDSETRDMKLLEVPEDLEHIATKAYNALRYMIKNKGIVDEYVHAWY